VDKREDKEVIKPYSNEKKELLEDEIWFTVALFVLSILLRITNFYFNRKNMFLNYLDVKQVTGLFLTEENKFFVYNRL
jgi:hypothetical protein